MTTIYKQRMSAQIEGDFVIFLIGMRINKPWKIHKWYPVFRVMPAMLKELSAHPESGFLGFTQAGLTFIQYWRSFDDLERYARAKDHLHWPAWMAFNQHVRHSDGDVGIWHETYHVAAGAYETIYGGMPAFGLGKATTLVPASGHRQGARGRYEGSKEVVAAAYSAGEAPLNYYHHPLGSSRPIARAGQGVTGDQYVDALVHSGAYF